MPHPYDHHLDHAHASYFVTEALSVPEVRAALPERLAILTYLVHYPSWPTGRSAPPHALVPPALPDTGWLETGLDPDDLAAKQSALAEHETQLAVMGGFLRGFLRHNEVFGVVDREVLQRIASVH
jgi:LmbE family N-acetylglucosaminyl deacetylase